LDTSAGHVFQRETWQTCLTLEEKRCTGTAALVDGGDGGSDEQTPNAVIIRPT